MKNSSCMKNLIIDMKFWVTSAMARWGQEVAEVGNKKRCPDAQLCAVINF